MRKKITALGLSLLSMVGFANAQEVYTWSIQEGSTVENFSEIQLTISNITNPDGFSAPFGASSDCCLHTSDGKVVGSFGWNWMYEGSVVDGSITYTLPISESECWPDYPVSVNGDYYVRIPEGFFGFDYVYDSSVGQATYRKSPELKVNFSIYSDPGFVSIANATITPSDPTLKSLPEYWEVTFDNSEITSAELIGEVPYFYKSSWQQYELDYEVEADGKSIKLYPSEDLKNGYEYFDYGDCRIILFANSLQFNGDAAKTNDLIQFYYTIPETCKFNSYNLFPEEGKISKVNEFIYYFQESGATVNIAEQAQDGSNIPNIQYFDSNLNQWIPIAFFNTEVIPSVKDENGYDTYPGIKLTLMEDYLSMTFPEGEYKVVIPYGAYIVTTLETSWDPSRTLESAYFEASYTIGQAPAVFTTPVWGFEDGSVFSSFSETTVYFEGLQNVEFVDVYDSTLSPILYRVNEDGSLKELGTLNAGRMEGWDQILEVDNGSVRIYMLEDTFSPYYPLDIDGEYKIVMKKGFLKLEGFNDLVNDASEISFKIQNPTLLKAEYATITPAPGEIKEYPKEVVITFENDAIETLEIGLVNTYVGWDSENYVDIYEMLPAKADFVLDYGYYAYACGQYDITINPENPKSIILTPNASSIPEDALLQYGSYSFRIPRGGLVANKGTETECVNSVLDFGTYLNEQRYRGEIFNPMPDSEVEELYTFKLKYLDDNGSEGWGTLQVGEATPQLFVYDIFTSDWRHHSDLVAETVVDDALGYEIPVVRLPYEPVVAGGKYKVVIPRGTFLFDQYGSSVVGDLVEAEYTIVSDVKPYEIETDPAEGDVPFLDDIKVKLTEMSGAYIYACPAENAAVALNEAGEIVAYANMESVYNEDWSISHVIDFEPPIVELGAYRVVVASDVICTDYDGIGDNDSFELKFNVIGGDPVLSVTPADGSTVKELVNFVFTWAGAIELVVDPTKMVGGAKLYAEAEDGTRELYSDISCSPEGYKSVTLNIMDLSKPMNNGKYVLDIPAGLFSVNGKPCDAMSFTYNLEGVTYEISVTEAPLNVLTLTVNNCDELNVDDSCSEKITLWYVTGGEKQVGTYVAGTPVGTTVELTLAEPIEVVDGDYIVWIPEGYFWVGNDKSKDVKLAIDGVVSVETIEENVNFDIYSINGMIIKRNGNKADLKALDPGVYVVNGKKVLVK